MKGRLPMLRPHLGNDVAILGALVRHLPAACGWDVFVSHDDRCGRFLGLPCNCDPEIRIRRVIYAPR